MAKADEGLMLNNLNPIAFPFRKLGTIRADREREWKALQGGFGMRSTFSVTS